MFYIAGDYWNKLTALPWCQLKFPESPEGQNEDYDVGEDVDPPDREICSAQIIASLGKCR